MLLANLSPEQQAAALAAQARRGGEQPAGVLLPLYWRAYTRAWLGQVWATLNGRSRRLLDLSASAEQVRAIHAAGVQSVPVAQIVGSENRCNDFDRAFLPLQTRSWDRWRNIARAWQRGTILPPVELIRIGERYFVRDGHHRISVAAVVGQQEVDAVVTVWVV